MEKKEGIDTAQLLYLKYNSKLSSKDSEDLSVGFHRDITTREIELNNNEVTKENYHVRTSLSDVFGFAEHQVNATFALVYEVTIRINSDNHVRGHENELMLKILL